MSKHCLLVYFSQGGTTKIVSEKIQAGLERSGWTVTSTLLAPDTDPDVSAYDMVGIGLPTYFYKPPFLVSDYLDRVTGMAGKPFFVFVLYGTYIGDAGNWARRALSRKQGRDAGYLKVRGADMFLGYLREGMLFSPDAPHAHELEEAEAFGKTVAARACGASCVPVPPDSRPKFVNRLERFFLTPYLFRRIYSRYFKLDADACIRCGLCRKICPTNNIFMESGQLPVWGRNCIGCVNCEMKCPVGAVRSPFAWPISRVFLKINVWKASRDPGIAKARVVHEKGKLRRLS